MLLGMMAGCASEAPPSGSAEPTDAIEQTVAPEPTAETEPRAGPEQNAESEPQGVSVLSGTINRHPLGIAADRLKEALYMMGFRFVDNGDGMEIEAAGESFATWEEPGDVFGWQSDPAYLGKGECVLRTRILPVQLNALNQSAPLRLAAHGNVYNKNDLELAKRSQIEGFVAEQGLSLDFWNDFWNQYAIVLFGLGSTAALESVGEESFKITVTNQSDGNTYEIGYTGPASDEAISAAGVNDDYDAWVFILDVDQFAVQYFSLPDRSVLYENDIEFLKQFTSDTASGGYTPDYRLIDTLRQMRYLQVCGDSIYPDGIYVKMNMIQEEWDTNNSGYLLVEPLGEHVAMRTVLTPSIEDILGRNYQSGVEEAFIFEVGHIFKQGEGETLPRETVSLTMGAYGPDVTMESFTADVEAVLALLGFTSLHYVQTDMAIAYELCYVILKDGDPSLNGNYGQISTIATENFGIGDPAFMANLDITAMVQLMKNPDALIESAH